MNDLVIMIKEEGDGIELFFLYVIIFLGVLLVVLVVFVVFGNVFIIIVFVRDKSLWIVYNMYLVNLVVIDFCFGFFSMFFYLVYIFVSYNWLFGYYFCKVFFVVDFMFCLEFIIIIVMISFDCLFLLKYGLYYIVKEIMKKMLIKIFVFWILLFLLYLFVIIGWDLWMGEDINELGDCDV